MLFTVYVCITKLRGTMKQLLYAILLTTPFLCTAMDDKKRAKEFFNSDLWRLTPQQVDEYLSANTYLRDSAKAAEALAIRAFKLLQEDLSEAQQLIAEAKDYTGTPLPKKHRKRLDQYLTFVRIVEFAAEYDGEVKRHDDYPNIEKIKKGLEGILTNSSAKKKAYKEEALKEEVSSDASSDKPKLHTQFKKYLFPAQVLGISLLVLIVGYKLFSSSQSAEHA